MASIADNAQHVPRRFSVKGHAARSVCWTFDLVPTETSSAISSARPLAVTKAIAVTAVDTVRAARRNLEEGYDGQG